MNESQAQGERGVEVHVKSLKTNDKTQFKVSMTTTVGQVWDEAIDPDHLNEQRTPTDTFRCADGTDLTGRLTTTLAQLDAEEICRAHHFEIRGQSGGA